MRRVLLPALAAAVLAAAPPGGPRDPRQIRLVPVAPVSCIHDRLMLGPDGGVAVWGNEQSNLIAVNRFPPFGFLLFGTMRDAPNPPTPFLSYEGPQATIPLRWSASGDVLYVWNRQGRIVSVDRGNGAVKEAGSLDESFRRVEFRTTSHGGIEGLGAALLLARAARVDGNQFYRGVVTLGKTEDVIAARTGDLDLVRLENSGTVSPPALSLPYTRWLLGIPEGSGFEGGIAYVGAENHSFPVYFPLQRPLIDLASGTVTGSFGATQIWLRQEGSLAGPLRALRTAVGKTDIILDASQSGNVLALLTRSIRGELRIRRISPAGLGDQSLCSRELWDGGGAEGDSAGAQVRFFTLDRMGRETSQPGRPILAEYRATAKAADEAVVFLHGGPAGSLVDADYLAGIVKHLLRPGRDVLGLSYSGSVGGGASLTRRLTAGGLTSIEQDVDALVAWLDRNHYRRVFLIGESFGGVPSLVALARHPDRFRAVLMIAPLLKLRDPETWVESGAFNKTSAVGQRRFEEGVFGGAAGRTRFAADLDKLLASTHFRSADRIFFGEHDLMSIPGDLPAGVKVQFRVLKGGNHATLGNRREVWEEIQAAVATPHP
jgi:pimeloyl-ACP methyl ester carboxylesterase